MKRITLVQPLPPLLYGPAGHAYSEFGSLGLALLGGVLRDAGYHLTGVLHPSQDEEIRRLAREADIIIVGDFRYYAYFCNPLPLVARVLDTLDSVGFEGTVLLGGRHAAFFPPELCTRLGGNRCRVRICPTMSTLANELALPQHLSARLGADILPFPGYAPPDLLFTSATPGSVSRPISVPAGQIITVAGCRYRCAFCEKAGTVPVAIAPSTLERQLSEFRDARVTYLIVWDEVFGQDPSERERTLIEFRRAGMRFGCNTRADVITEPFAQQLASAGCEAVLFGIELAADEEHARRRLRVDRKKSPGAARLQAVVKLLAGLGVKAVGSVVIGLPGDTEGIIRSRLSRCGSLGFSQLYVRPLVPFPGSALYAGEVQAGRLAAYGDWNAEAWDTYPHGYPTFSDVPRRELCHLAGRTI